MVKNIYFYLAYLSLELNDYAGTVRYGQECLKQFGSKLLAKTEFSLRMYLVEANCMLGLQNEALKVL